MLFLQTELRLGTPAPLTAAATLALVFFAGATGAPGLNAFGLARFGGFLAPFNAVLMNFLRVLLFRRFLTAAAGLTAAALVAALLGFLALAFLLFSDPAGSAGDNAFGFTRFGRFLAPFNAVLMDFFGMLHVRGLLTPALTALGLTFLGRASFLVAGLIFAHKIKC